MSEPFLAHSEITNEIYIICGKKKYPVTEQVVSAMKATGRLNERPQGEQVERALAIIDRLRTDGHINNKEQGALRRAILLPELGGSGAN